MCGWMVKTLVGLWVACGVAMPCWAADNGGGFFIVVGGVNNSVVGEINGTHSYTNTSSTSNQTIYDGKLDDGKTGLALLVGYAINPYVGVEVEVDHTAHKATNSLLNTTTNADFASAFIGGRLTLPLARSFAAFVRGGWGAYVLSYDDFAVTNGSNQTGRVVYSGGGSAFGAGLEIRGTHLGVALAFTEHHFLLDNAAPEGGNSGSISPRLHGLSDMTSLMLEYYF